MGVNPTSILDCNTSHRDRRDRSSCRSVQPHTPIRSATAARLRGHRVHAAFAAVDVSGSKINVLHPMLTVKPDANAVAARAGREQQMTDRIEAGVTFTPLFSSSGGIVLNTSLSQQ